MDVGTSIGFWGLLMYLAISFLRKMLWKNENKFDSILEFKWTDDQNAFLQDVYVL